MSGAAFAAAVFAGSRTLAIRVAGDFGPRILEAMSKM